MRAANTPRAPAIGVSADSIRAPICPSTSEFPWGAKCEQERAEMQKNLQQGRWKATNW